MYLRAMVLLTIPFTIPNIADDLKEFLAEVHKMLLSIEQKYVFFQKKHNYRDVVIIREFLFFNECLLVEDR